MRLCDAFKETKDDIDVEGSKSVRDLVTVTGIPEFSTQVDQKK